MMNKRAHNHSFCNFSSKNRKGISSIIATLLLILLTMALLSILWIVVRGISSSAGEGISLAGITLDLKIQGAGVGTNNLSVLVQRQPGAGDLVGINFVVYDGEVYEVVKLNTTLDIYDGEEFVFVVNEVSIAEVKTVSVAPVYSSSGAEKVGSITDTYTFVAEDFLPGGGGGETPFCGDGTCNVGETSSSCPAECSVGGPVCGNDILESGEQCDDGNTVNGDGCSSACQDEVPGAVCGNTDCESGETEASCPADCSLSGCSPTTCLLNNYGCGNPPDGCGGTLSCGTCNPSTSFCDSEWHCIAYELVNSGQVQSVWPSGSIKFFDSLELPNTPSEILDGSYNDGLHHIRFPGSLGDACIRISLLDIIEPGVRAYVSLYSAADISANDNYDIWNYEQGCLNALGG